MPDTVRRQRCSANPCIARSTALHATKVSQTNLLTLVEIHTHVLSDALIVRSVTRMRPRCT